MTTDPKQLAIYDALCNEYIAEQLALSLPNIADAAERDQRVAGVREILRRLHGTDTSADESD